MEKIVSGMWSLDFAFVGLLLYFESLVFYEVAWKLKNVSIALASFIATMAAAGFLMYHVDGQISFGAGLVFNLVICFATSSIFAINGGITLGDSFGYRFFRLGCAVYIAMFSVLLWFAIGSIGASIVLMGSAVIVFISRLVSPTQASA